MAKKAMFELEADEQIEFEGKANKTGFWGGGGGTLVLTDKRLIFADRRRKAIHTQFELKDLIYVGKALTWTIWLIILPLPTAIKVTTRTSRSQKFTVVDRSQWVELINKRISS